MSGYRRFVAYVYEYRKGKKESNCGFIKVEVRDGRCTMEVHLHVEGLTPDVECRVYGFVRKDGLMNGILLGSCETGNDTMECLIETDSLNMGGSGIAMGRMGGIVLTTKSGGFFGTEWDDQPIRPANFREMKIIKEFENEKPKIVQEVKPEQESKEILEKITPEEALEASSEKATPEEMQEAESGKAEAEEIPEAAPGKAEAEEIPEAATENATAEKTTEVRAENEPELMKNSSGPDEAEVKATDITQAVRPIRPPMPPTPGERPNQSDERPPQQSKRPSQPGERPPRPPKSFGEEFTPFEDSDAVQCWKIHPQDFRCLSQRQCALRNNRFLHYGYYNFGHILLCRRANGQYILGVPGAYDQQERFMANMFGFPYFKESRMIEVPKGRGGYWYRLIDAPDFH